MRSLVRASREELGRIAKIPKREFMRRGINQHTLEKICKREPVRAIKLVECLQVFQKYELERGTTRSHNCSEARRTSESTFESR